MAIDLIEEFLLPLSSFEEYINDIKTQSAVERQLGVMGEAVSKFDKLYPESTLNNAREIIGFRNRLIHAYDAVDPSMIWVIIKKYLDPLKKEVKKKLKQ